MGFLSGLIFFRSKIVRRFHRKNQEKGITLKSHKKLKLSAKGDISIRTPKRVIIRAKSQILLKKKNANSGLSIENEFHILGDEVHFNGRDRTQFEPYEDEPQQGEKPKFNWWELAGKALAAAVVVVGVAAVAVATAGVGAGALALAVGGMMIAGDVETSIRTGKVQSWGEFLMSAGVGAVVGAVLAIPKVAIAAGSMLLASAIQPAVRLEIPIVPDTPTTGPTVLEAAEMADHVYFTDVAQAKDDVLLGGWRLQDYYAKGSLQLGVYARANPATGRIEYTIANRGTTDMEGWKENVKQPFGGSVDVKSSLKYVKGFVERKSPETEITFVGHSKGGAEAAANAVFSNRNAIIFNPAAVNLNAYGLDGSKYNASMTSYIVEGEALNDGLYSIIPVNPIDKVVYLPSPYSEESTWNPVKMAKDKVKNAVSNHMMDAMKQALAEAGYK